MVCEVISFYYEMMCNKFLETMKEEMCPDFKFFTFLSEKKMFTLLRKKNSGLSYGLTNF